MADVASSPGDPIFFMHHSFIDRNWRVWQNADPARVSEVGGNTVADGSGPQLDLSFVLTSMGLRDDVTVGDVIDSQGGHLCYQYSY
jgi:tyrosinase